MLKENEFTNNVNQFNFQTVNDALIWKEWKYYSICAFTVLNMIDG